MFTGQISSHALHVVHAHSSSDVIRSNIESAVTVMSRSTPTGGDTCGSPVNAITSPTFNTISRGSSGLPVACAGHTDVQRPQIVHASVSNSCFQVKSSTVDAGADVFLVPAEWVRGPLKEHHWRTLLHARAIENTVFVAAADHPPPLGVGNSLIVDPLGVELAAIGTSTDVAVAHLDVGAIERVRRVNPSLTLRRFRVEPR